MIQGGVLFFLYGFLQYCIAFCSTRIIFYALYVCLPSPVLMGQPVTVSKHNLIKHTLRTCRAIAMTTQHLSPARKASCVLASTPLPHQFSWISHILISSLATNFPHAVLCAQNTLPFLTHLEISKAPFVGSLAQLSSLCYSIHWVYFFKN